MEPKSNNQNPRRYHHRGYEIKVWVQEKTADLLFDWGVVKLSKTICRAITLDAALIAAKKCIDDYLDKGIGLEKVADDVIIDDELPF